MAKAPLRILLTDPHLSGGGQVSYVLRLAGELRRCGHDITVGCKAGSLLARRAAETGIPVHDGFVYRGGLRPRSWYHDVVEVRRYIRTQAPHVIHVSGSQDHWVSALGNRSMGRPVCLVRTRHNTYPVKSSFPNRVLNRDWTDYQIVVCDTVRKTLAAQPVFDANRMCAIHNGVDVEQFRPDATAREEARNEFGYGPEHVVFGIAARLVKDKGHEFLFHAAAEIQADHPEIRILVLGQGDLEKSLRKLAVDLGIAPIIRFAGFREDMPRCTQAFDVGVLPSIGCDTSSFSLKEEMAAEKPVIASDYGGLKEILDDGQEGYVVPTATVQPLGAALRRMLEDPGERVRLGRAARARVLREFSIETFAEKTLGAYHRAIKLHQQRIGKTVEPSAH